MVRESVLKQHPEIEQLMGTISKHLTDDVMQDLNGRVDIDGQDPADVAYDWLISEKLVVPPK